MDNNVNNQSKPIKNIKDNSRLLNILDKVDAYVMKPIILAGCYITAAVMLHHAVATSQGTKLTPSQAVDVLKKELARPYMKDKKVNLFLLHNQVLKNHGVGGLCLMSDGKYNLFFDKDNLDVKKLYHELAHVKFRKPVSGTVTLEKALKSVDAMYERYNGKISFKYLLSKEEFMCNARAVYLSYKWNHNHSQPDSIDSNIYLTQQQKSK